jgi:hypothetical protein
MNQRPISIQVTPDHSPSEQIQEQVVIHSEHGTQTPDHQIYSMGSWDETQQRFMKQMIDRAKCYIWLYDRSFRLYKTLWLVYMIPVLVITTFSGVANLGQLGFSDPNLEQTKQARIIYPIVLGILNIFAAILTSLMQFFKIAEQKECHRRAGKDWQLFSTDLEIIYFAHFDLTVRNRKFEKMLNRYKQLLERSPSIPKIYLYQLNQQYSSRTDLVLPEIVGQIKTLDLHTKPNPQA